VAIPQKPTQLRHEEDITHETEGLMSAYSQGWLDIYQQYISLI